MKGLFIVKDEVLYRATKQDETADSKEYTMDDIKDLLHIGMETGEGEQMYIVGETQEEVQEVINKFFKPAEQCE